MSGRNIFLSYSHNDSEIALDFYDKLKKHGLTVWMDKKDMSLGTSWTSAIENAIDNASVIVFLITPNAKDSQWIKEEVKLARSKGKAILPVYLEGDIPESLTEHQMLDLSAIALSDDFENRLDDMLEKMDLNQYAG